MDDCALKIRVCRMWESMDPKKNDELLSIDMILIDEQANMIHAVIPQVLGPQFKNCLKEGRLYYFENLQITSNTGIYRPVSNKFKIHFSGTTTVTQLEEEKLQISRHLFQFIQPKLIASRVNDNTILTDVVGCLRIAGALEIFGGDQQKRDITIFTNYSITTKITLWGKLGELFDISALKKDGTPNVVIVTSTTINQSKDEIFFSTTNASKIYINLDDSFVASLRERFLPLSKGVEILQTSPITNTQPEEEMFVNRMNVKELTASCFGEEIEELNVIVRATIIGICKDFGWFYDTCNVCLETITKDDTQMCTNCDTKIDYPLTLFKIHIKVMDGTSTTTFVLYNMVSELLLDTSAKKIVNRFSSNQRDIPQELETLVGTDLVFKLRLNRRNMREGYTHYTVLQVFHPRQDLETTFELEKTIRRGWILIHIYLLRMMPTFITRHATTLSVKPTVMMRPFTRGSSITESGKFKLWTRMQTFKQNRLQCDAKI